MSTAVTALTLSPSEMAEACGVPKLAEARKVIDGEPAVYGAPVDGTPDVDTHGITTTPTLEGKGARGQAR